ncbi:putative phage abortive infection protein [Reichenbachiella sp. MSK19-1]|uniref:putative phage abortive infection protein n=1 Tax=Reichenbachiella sp. MSK19-1 TaxID=1897631 RepID=UPI000E6C26DC|nr:putative phage abortive infection protein [Reichenbachiella sp. MSK19-1]RJE71495.1 hypothetical protein BGP76_05195 [Reichenbachiella sp. MSK19-1]
MNKKKLEKEIESASKRIQERQLHIETEINELSSNIKKYTNWAWIFVWIGAAVSLFALLFYLCKNTESGFGLNLLGDFMAGTVASIWSLAGLFFIYVAFLGQKQQLLNQQLEIMYSQLEVKYTRLELAGQKEEMAIQNSTLKQQKTENTFFQLLANHNSIVNSLDLLSTGSNGREVLAQGRDCFVQFHKRFERKFSQKKSLYGIEEVLMKYNEFFNENVSDLGHYFRNLYHIIKFIDQSDIENKKRYTNFVRAQLSSGELAIIFYNCLSDYGNKKFKPLIERYSLLKNRDQGLLLNVDHEGEYEKEAFE